MNRKIASVVALLVFAALSLATFCVIAKHQRSSLSSPAPSSSPTSSEVGELYPERGWPLHVLRDEKRHVTCYADTIHGGVSCLRDEVSNHQEPKSN